MPAIRTQNSGVRDQPVEEPETASVSAADVARLDALMAKHRKPPRPMSPEELAAWRRKGGLRDPGTTRQPPLPDGTPNPNLRTAAVLCMLVCTREHCRRHGRCMHRIVPALRENMHWLLRAYYEYHGLPIPPQVLAAERGPMTQAQIRAGLTPEQSEADLFAPIGGDNFAPLNIRKVE